MVTVKNRLLTNVTNVRDILHIQSDKSHQYGSDRTRHGVYAMYYIHRLVLANMYKKYYYVETNSS